jgi:hypothetical protein
MQTGGENRHSGRMLLRPKLAFKSLHNLRPHDPIPGDFMLKISQPPG